VYFEVYDFDPLLSDIHKALTFSLKCQTREPMSSSANCQEGGNVIWHEKIIWDVNNKYTFLSFIDFDIVNGLILEIENIKTYNIEASEKQ